MARPGKRVARRDSKKEQVSLGCQWARCIFSPICPGKLWSPRSPVLFTSLTAEVHFHFRASKRASTCELMHHESVVRKEPKPSQNAVFLCLIHALLFSQLTNYCLVPSDHAVLAGCKNEAKFSASREKGLRFQHLEKCSPKPMKLK